MRIGPTRYNLRSFLEIVNVNCYRETRLFATTCDSSKMYQSTNLEKKTEFLTVSRILTPMNQIANLSLRRT